MIRTQQSPLLGEVVVVDRWPELPTDGRLGFHQDELKMLKEAKAGPEMWQAVALVKAVFPGAYVTGTREPRAVRLKRYEKTWAKSRSFAKRGAPPAPEYLEEE